MGDLWFIYSPVNEAWGGLRLAVFAKPRNEPHTEIVTILGEIRGRIGIRIWQDIEEREQWVKVKRIEQPTAEEIAAAMV